VNVTILSEQRAEVGENTAAIRGVNVVKKTVHQNKIEALVRRDLISRGIGRNKFSLMTASCVFDVRWIAVDTDVVRVGKVPRIRAWTTAHIEYSPDLLQIIMIQHRSEFVFSEWSLPKPVSVGEFHYGGRDTH
jgi:hypothetical protein